MTRAWEPAELGIMGCRARRERCTSRLYFRRSQYPASSQRPLAKRRFLVRRFARGGIARPSGGASRRHQREPRRVDRLLLRLISCPLTGTSFLSRAPSRRARCSVAWWAKGRLGSLPPDPCRPRPHLASARTLGSRTSMPETMCCYQPTAQCAEHTQHTKLPVTHNISCCCPFTL